MILVNNMRKNLNKIISTPIGILILILIVVIVGGGILTYQYLWLPKEKTNNVVCTMEVKLCPDGSYVGRTGPNCEFAKCPGIENEIANWEIYRSEQMGFEIKYPPDLGVSYERVSSTGTEVYFYKPFWIVDEKINYIIMSIDMGIYYSQELMREYTLDEWINENFLPLKEGESKKTIGFGVDNYKGIKIEAVGIIKLIPYVFIQRDKNIYEIIGNVPSLTTEFPKDYEPNKIYNQMLSTFKFLR
jgi:hypothetical protein